MGRELFLLVCVDGHLPVTKKENKHRMASRLFLYSKTKMRIVMLKQLLLIVLCTFTSLAANGQDTYYGNVGDYISLPEPIPPVSTYTVMQMTYSTNSEHLYVVPGTSRVKIVSYFSYKEVVKCEYRMVRQYYVAGRLYEDWQTGTTYYYIECLGSDPNPDPDPDPDPDPGTLNDGDYFQDYTPEGNLMLFIFTHLYGEACAIVVPNKYGGSCIGSANGKVTIPTKAKGYPVRRISNAAFYQLSDMTELIIPSSVTSIDTYAILSCSGLKSITCQCETPPTSLSSDGNIFDYGVFYNTTLYVPKGCKSKYSSAKGWEKFKTIKEIGEESAVDDVVISNVSTQGIYSLSGQRLDAPRKGINIIGGRKVIVK